MNDAHGSLNYTASFPPRGNCSGYTTITVSRMCVEMKESMWKQAAIKVHCATLSSGYSV